MHDAPIHHPANGTNFRIELRGRNWASVKGLNTGNVNAYLPGSWPTKDLANAAAQVFLKKHVKFQALVYGWDNNDLLWGMGPLDSTNWRRLGQIEMVWIRVHRDHDAATRPRVVQAVPDELMEVGWEEAGKLEEEWKVENEGRKSNRTWHGGTVGRMKRNW